MYSFTASYLHLQMFYGYRVVYLCYLNSFQLHLYFFYIHKSYLVPYKIK